MELQIHDILDFLSTPKKIAVVGVSTNPKKAGYFVPKCLKERGFEIIPINPFSDQFLGMKTLKSLHDLDEKVDAVLIYRKKRDAEIEGQIAIAKGVPIIWLPKGITSGLLRNLTEEYKIGFVEDKCPKILIEKYLTSEQYCLMNLEVDHSS